jgi:SnoaL-like polyketide cyclase
VGHSETHQTLHGYFNRREFNRMDEHMRENLAYEDIPRGLTMKNRDEFKDWLGGWISAFSDARVDSATYHDGADFSLARFRGRGRNDGAMGPLPATGREMDNPFWELLRYDEEGKVISGGILYDQMTLLSQLGHIEPPAG